MPENVQPPPVPETNPANLLATARGLSAVFWGLTLIMLVLAGVLAFQVPFLARLPGHSIGLVLLLVGTGHLRKAWTGHADCRRWAGWFGLAVILHLYLVPFLGWWRAGTAAWYALLNLVLLTGSGLVLLTAIPRWVESMALLLGQPELRIEARLCGWVVPVMSALTVGLYILRAGRLAWYTDPAFALHHLLVESGPLVLLPAVLPFIPALAIAWSGKEHALRALVRNPMNHPERT